MRSTRRRAPACIPRRPSRPSRARCGSRPGSPRSTARSASWSSPSPRTLALKAEVLGEAATAFPGATLATNTSSIRIEDVGAAVGAPDRVVGTHYWNPPLLMPLVEVVPGPRTAGDRVTRVLEVLAGLGKRPVLVRREAPGFIWNRLQFALLREALWLVENGVASPETVDEVVRLGLARRLHLTGPFETAALGGAATFEAAAGNIFPSLSTATSVSGLGRWLSDDAERLGALRSARDAALAAELMEERRAAGAG